MASDAPSLARWWHAFCGGGIVSEESLTEMATMHDGYGLGLHERSEHQVAPGLERLPDRPGSVGHGGNQVGYTSLAACLPQDGAVVVVLSNGYEGELSAVADRLVDAWRSG
jgi:CubicO group peptidase (beta-lactamase class C family)